MLKQKKDIRKRKKKTENMKKAQILVNDTTLLIH